MTTQQRNRTVRQELEILVGPIDDKTWRRICAISARTKREGKARRVGAGLPTPAGRQRTEEVRYAALYM